MAKARRVRRCFHCGAILQTTDKNGKGFINEETITNNKPDALLYCNECYNNIRNIDNAQINYKVEKNILDILKDAVATDAFIIWAGGLSP